jgi:flagellar biosynthesis/type III secretory pathway M-ring protein FliF/YscJ
METAWGLVVVGLILVALASKPFQRARANAADRLQERKQAYTAPKETKGPSNALQAPSETLNASTGTSESLTPQWLDSLIGSDSAVMSDDPFDDEEGIAAILRLWLAEDSR